MSWVQLCDASRRPARLVLAEATPRILVTLVVVREAPWKYTGGHLERSLLVSLASLVISLAHITTLSPIMHVTITAVLLDKSIHIGRFA